MISRKEQGFFMLIPALFLLKMENKYKLKGLLTLLKNIFKNGNNLIYVLFHAFCKHFFVKI